MSVRTAGIPKSTHSDPPVHELYCRLPSGGACLNPLQGGGPSNILSPGHGSTVEPPEVAALAAEPPEVSVVSFFELSTCPVTAKKAVCELSSCPVTAKKAACELSPCPVTAKKPPVNSHPVLSRLWKPSVSSHPVLSRLEGRLRALTLSCHG